MKCSLLDVGAGGMALSSATLPPPGSFLRIRFSLPAQSGLLDADGTLVRKERRGSEWLWGIRFEDPQPYVSTRICRHLHANRSTWAKNLGATTGRRDPRESRALEARQRASELRKLYKEALNDLSGK